MMLFEIFFLKKACKLHELEKHYDIISQKTKDESFLKKNVKNFKK